MNIDNAKAGQTPEFTVVVAVSGVQRLPEMLQSYRPSIEAVGKPYEVLCVTDGQQTETRDELVALSAEWPELTVLSQRPWVDDDAALLVGIKRARSELILTLPGWPEIDSAALPWLFDKLEDHDLVIATRDMEKQSSWSGLRRTAFNKVLHSLFGLDVSDPFCRVRLGRKAPMEDAGALGTRQHFIPAIMSQRGFDVIETVVPQAPSDAAKHTRFFFKPLGHVQALLDALMLFVVLKFLRRPMRFFGSVGLPIVLIGAIGTAFLVGDRIFGDTALANRPALIFFVMMLVFGMQVLALGLVGEIIIFAHSRRMKQYSVRSVIRHEEPTTEKDPPVRPRVVGGRTVE